MRLLRRKSRLQRLRGTVDSLAGPVAKKLDMPDWASDKAVKAGLITVGGLTGLTAGSAGISSLRRRVEGPEGHS
jgi:hypothetical protein